MQKLQDSPFVFLSYARADIEIATRLIADLEARGLVVWVDQHNIPTGTHDWEQNIRAALQVASAVVLLASPQSRESTMVRDELRLAEDRQCPIYPFWIAGEKWMESISLGRGSIQFLDARGERYKDALTRLMRDLKHGAVLQHKQAVTRRVSATTPKQGTGVVPPLRNLLAPNKKSRPTLIWRAVLVGLVLLIIGSISSLYLIVSRSNAQQQCALIGSTDGTATATAAAQSYDAAATQGIMYGFDSQNSHYNPFEKILNPKNVSCLKLAWTTKLGDDSLQGGPIVAEGRVYIGSFGGTLFMIDASTGKPLGNHSTGDRINMSPAVAEGIVYVSSWDNYFYALDASNGEPKWKFRAGDRVESPSTIAQRVVYYGSDDKNLYARDAIDGTLKWKYPTNNVVRVAPAVVNGIIYFGSFDKNLYALNATTGKRSWSSPTGGLIESSPTVANGVVYVGSDDGCLYALDAQKGTPRWSKPKCFGVGNSVISPAVVDGVVYISSHNGYFYALDAQSGTSLWSYRTNGTVDYPPMIANGIIYFSSNDGKTNGYIYALDFKTSKLLWSFKTKELTSSSLAVANGMVYVGSSNGNLYAFSLP